eukprot:4385355-Alexandrium_andersonii.AAC.1
MYHHKQSLLGKQQILGATACQAHEHLDIALPEVNGSHVPEATPSSIPARCRQGNQFEYR